MEHKGTVSLTTNRLLLRRFNMNDTEAMYDNWASDPEVTRYLMWQPHSSRDETKRILGLWLNHYGENTFYQWAICFQSKPEEPIGSISIVRQDELAASVHIGYCIGRKWWHQGITTEALAAVIRFSFEELRANRVESRHDPRNPNSGKVMAKCGMNYEATIRQSDWNCQGICDTVLYGLLAEEYFSTTDGQATESMALLVVDMQKALLEAQPYDADQVIQRIQALLTAARANHKEVIFIRHTEQVGGVLAEGSEGWQIDSRLEPLANERIFDKLYNSAFYQTGLKQYLDHGKMRTILLVGMQTEYCIDATCKSAFEQGFKVIIPEGCNTTYSNQILSAEKLIWFYNTDIWYHFAQVLPLTAVIDLLEKP